MSATLSVVSTFSLASRTCKCMREPPRGIVKDRRWNKISSSPCQTAGHASGLSLRTESIGKPSLKPKRAK
eukprot:2472523-Amphidinium_carterae.1